MITYSFRVGLYEVTVSVAERSTLLDLQFEWSPHVPAKLTRAERRQYERGRSKALAHLVEALTEAARAERVLLDPDPLRVIH